MIASGDCLYKAVVDQSWEMIKYLMNHPASVDYAPALCHAILYGYTDMAVYLLTHGATRHIPYGLYLAITMRDIEVLDAMLAVGYHTGCLYRTQVADIIESTDPTVVMCYIKMGGCMPKN